MAKLIDRPLAEQSVAFWAARGRTGAAGLVLLDKLMKNVAEHRDWNGLAIFLKGAKAAKQDAIVKRIIFHVFGTNLVAKTVAVDKHKSGISFVMKWDGALDLSQSNSYSVIRAAIDAGKSWDDLTLFKSLAKPEPKVKTRDSARYASEGKALKNKFDKLRAEGLNIMDILKAAGVILSPLDVAPAERGLVEKSVVNGVTVYTPDF